MVINTAVKYGHFPKKSAISRKEHGHLSSEHRVLFFVVIFLKFKLKPYKFKLGISAFRMLVFLLR